LSGLTRRASLGLHATPEVATRQGPDRLAVDRRRVCRATPHSPTPASGLVTLLLLLRILAVVVVGILMFMLRRYMTR
jgi:hypothetical protein